MLVPVWELHTHEHCKWSLASDGTYLLDGTLTCRALSARDAKEWRWLIEEARLKAVDARMATGTGAMRGF